MVLEVAQKDKSTTSTKKPMPKEAMFREIAFNLSDSASWVWATETVMRVLTSAPSRVRDAVDILMGLPMNSAL